MLGRRTRRLVRTLLTLIVSIILLAAIGIGYLRLTNPKPGPSPGWARLADMPNARGEVASANVGARFVVAGGLSGVGSVSDAVSVYQIEKDEWGSARALPSPRHHAAAAALGDQVYVSGGSAGLDFTPTDTVWRAPPGGRWRAIARMPEARQGHAMVAMGSRLYVVGGVGLTTRTLVYDLNTKRWTTAAPLSVGRNHLRAVAWRNEIWAIGGRGDQVSDQVDVYDPRRDRWRTAPDLPRPMSAMAVGVIGGALHVLGGEVPDTFGGRVISDHFALRAGARRWATAPKAILAIHGAGYAAHGERLIVAGGASRHGGFSVISWTGVTQVYDPGL